MSQQWKNTPSVFFIICKDLSMCFCMWYNLWETHENKLFLIICGYFSLFQFPGCLSVNVGDRGNFTLSIRETFMWRNNPADLTIILTPAARWFKKKNQNIVPTWSCLTIIVSLKVHFTCLHLFLFRFTCPEKLNFMPELAFISADHKYTIKCITSVLCTC